MWKSVRRKHITLQSTLKAFRRTVASSLPVAKKSQKSLTLKNFSPDDLLAIAPNIPAEWNRRIIELEPADGIVDWAVIARFPTEIGWRFHNVKKWRNTETTHVTSDFFAFYGGTLELPAQFSVKEIVVADDVDVPKQVRQMLVNGGGKYVLPGEISEKK